MIFFITFLRFKFTIPGNSTILKGFDYLNAMINYWELMKIRSWKYNNSNNSERCTRCVINLYWQTLQYGENSFCLVMKTSMIYGFLQVSPIWRVIKFDYTYDDVSVLIAKELYRFPLLVKPKCVALWNCHC